MSWSLNSELVCITLIKNCVSLFQTCIPDAGTYCEALFLIESKSADAARRRSVLAQFQFSECLPFAHLTDEISLEITKVKK